jgi:8-oxo-dGTP pyrophosphatase MutT (NUDIX family)/phosphohistidine phosphatase SixA
VAEGMATAEAPVAARLDVTLVRAAGGLVMRDGPGGPEVVLVHRPAYGDWSFPKGKLESGEDEATAALREVEEETGLVCRLGDDLGAITYVDGRGRPKIVRYWRMTSSVGGKPRGLHEVDDARWVGVAGARSALTYNHDRTVLARAIGEGPPGDPVPVYVIRHVKAGSRADWHEPDELRPISKVGRKQAAKLADAFHDVAFTRLLSSPYLRCTQSLHEIADRVGIDIDLEPELGEGHDAAAAEALVLAAAADGVAALCTHGDVYMDLIGNLLARGVPRTGDGPVSFKKGSAWRLDVTDGRITSLSYLPPPPR